MILDLLFVRSRLYPGSETRIEAEGDKGPGILLRSSFFLLRRPPPLRSEIWYPKVISLVRDLPLTGFGLIFRHRGFSSVEGLGFHRLLNILNEKNIQEFVVEQWPPEPLDLFPHLRTITFLPRSKLNLLRFFGQPRPEITTVIGGKIPVRGYSPTRTTIRDVRQTLRHLFRLLPNLQNGDITFTIPLSDLVLDSEHLKMNIQVLLTQTTKERPNLSIRILWKADS